MEYLVAQPDLGVGGSGGGLLVCAMGSCLSVLLPAGILKAVCSTKATDFRIVVWKPTHPYV